MLPSTDTPRARVTLIAGALLIGVSSSAACSPFDASLVGEADDTAIGCTEGNTRPPPRPAATAGPDAGADEPDFWVALRDVLLNQEDGQWAAIGYNIDGRCTTAANAAMATECLPIEGRSHEVDGSLGIDNSFGHNLFPLLNLAYQGLDQQAIDAELIGLGNPLIRIRGWNGTLNDSSVQMVLTQSVFATPSNEGALPSIHVIGSAGFLDSEGTMPVPLPVWDGTDYFWGRDDTFLDPEAAVGGNIDAATPLVIDSNAYVANGILVATVADGTEIILVGDGLGTRVALSGMIATANIAAMKLEGADHIEVTIAGRWGYNDLLRTAESVGVCPGSDQFRLLMTQVNAMTDVLLDPVPANLGTRCDAVSLGITFQAYPANFGGIADGQDLPTPLRRHSLSRTGAAAVSGSAEPGTAPCRSAR